MFTFSLAGDTTFGLQHFGLLEISTLYNDFKKNTNVTDPSLYPTCTYANL